MIISNDFKNKIKNHKHSTKYQQKNGALSIMLELFSGILVGFIIGYFSDLYFNTAPYLLITFLCVGTLAAMLNIYRYIIK